MINVAFRIDLESSLSVLFSFVIILSIILIFGYPYLNTASGITSLADATSNTTLSANTTCMINNAPNRTSMINGNPNTDKHNHFNPLVTGIKLGGNPFSIAVNPSANIIYIADKLIKKITFLDGNTDRQIKTVTITNNKSSNLSANPEDLKSSIAFATSVNLLYVGSTDSNIISAIDGNDGSPVTSKTAGGGVKGLDANAENLYAITNRTIWTIYLLANRGEYRTADNRLVPIYMP